MRCRICDREAAEALCQYHFKAKDSVESRYRLWERAYGAIDWDAYLGKVIANPETGQWSKEIAQFLRETSNDKRDT